jgi:hypothetical protein
MREIGRFLRDGTILAALFLVCCLIVCLIVAVGYVLGLGVESTTKHLGGSDGVAAVAGVVCMAIVYLIAICSVLAKG